MEPVPELPEIAAYIHALEQRVLGQIVEAVRIRTPSLLKTFDPKVSELEGRRLNAIRRVGKRIVFELASASASRRTRRISFSSSRTFPGQS